MCALAYTMWLEEIRRRTDIEVQAALFARVMGNDVPLPDHDSIRRRFDELLVEEPAGLSLPTDRRALLLEAFGMRGR